MTEIQTIRFHKNLGEVGENQGEEGGHPKSVSNVSIATGDGNLDPGTQFPRDPSEGSRKSQPGITMGGNH